MRILLFILLIVTLIHCDFLTEPSLGDGYTVIGDEAQKAIAKKVEGKSGVYTPIILGQVKEYRSNSDFIIAFRRVTDSAKVYFEDDPLWNKQLGDTTQFWIINKNDDKVYGPLNQASYLKERKVLHVPDDLHLSGF